MMKQRFSLLLSLSFLTLSQGIFLKPATAQVTPDGTTNTTVNVDGNDFTIEQGDRVGDNLFHSFSEFSVLKDGSAFFNNAADIANIFSRVTGSNISNINGLLGANGAANLFLINPNGIIFGPNARLNLGGSFFASSADSLLFEGNAEFSASNPTAPPLLTISVPIGINFRDNPGDIVNRSTVENSAGDVVGLEVLPGKSLTLVGGNINFDAGNTTARGGNIELGGLSESGTVTLNEDGSWNFPEGVARADVSFTNAADVDVRGTGGGSITINAGNVELAGGESGASNLRAGIAPDSGSPDAQAGDITVNATNTISVSQGSAIANQLADTGVGNAGGINITTANLFLTEDGRVDASTGGVGDAGGITIVASGTISAEGKSPSAISVEGESPSGRPSGIFSDVVESGVGNAGGINITTANLSLTQGGTVGASTGGVGNTGAITINASGTILVEGGSSSIFNVVFRSGEGNAGGIKITTTDLFLREGGRVGANTFGKGDGGRITIEASRTISVDGESPSKKQSGIFNAVFEYGKGNAGGIKITTTNLSLTQGGRVGAGTFGEGNAGDIKINASDTILVEGETQDGGLSGIFSNNEKGNVWNGGKIKITTTNLSLKEGGQVAAATFGEGDAGSVYITASDTITISGKSKNNSSGLFANALINNGNGGNINVSADKITIDNNGTIEAGNFSISGERDPGTGEPGDIKIKANSLSLNNQARIDAATQSETEATTQSETDNITLQLTEDLILSENSLISARAFGKANGGNIDIDAEFIIAYPSQPGENGNDIIAKAQFGEGGNIEIKTKSLINIELRPAEPENGTNDIDPSSEFGLQGPLTFDPTSGLIEQTVIDASDEISQNICEQGLGSEFIITGKGGLPPNPGEPLNSDEEQVGLVEPVPSRQGEEETRREEEIKLEENDIRSEKSTPEAVPAQGWIFTDTGEVMLTSYKTPDTEIKRSPQKTPNICPTP